MTLSLIVAASENNVIGKENALPWHLPDDLQYFRSVTQGKVVIMGRKTYESIGRPLPNRRNIVLSQTIKYIEGCEVFPSLSDALLQLHTEQLSDDVFIIGGAKVFKEALTETLTDFSVRKLYLTRVHATIDGDVFLPEITWSHWKKLSSDEHAKDERHASSFTFEVYERI